MTAHTPLAPRRSTINHEPATPAVAPGGGRLVQTLDVTAKAILLAMLVVVLINPAYGNLEGKAPVARAVTYPLLAFLVSFVWLARHRPGPFPWGADLAVTAACFSDILGNRLDLYDTIVWFDDWIHFQNSALLSAAVLMLTQATAPTLTMLLERATAVALSASLGWELFEYFSFMTHSTERPMAYPDTLGDLSLSALGGVVAACAVHAARHAARRGVRDG